MSKNKTPDYVLRANANYRKKHTITKSLQLHNEKDADIIQALQNETKSFNALMKDILRNHYNLNQNQ